MPEKNFPSSPKKHISRFSYLLDTKKQSQPKSLTKPSQPQLFTFNICNNQPCKKQIVLTKQLKNQSQRQKSFFSYQTHIPYKFQLKSLNYQIFKQKIEQKSSLNSFHAYTPSKDSQNQFFNIINQMNQISTIQNSKSNVPQSNRNLTEQDLSDNSHQLLYNNHNCNRNNKLQQAIKNQSVLILQHKHQQKIQSPESSYSDFRLKSKIDFKISDKRFNLNFNINSDQKQYKDQVKEVNIQQKQIIIKDYMFPKPYLIQKKHVRNLTAGFQRSYQEDSKANNEIMKQDYIERQEQSSSVQKTVKLSSYNFNNGINSSHNQGKIQQNHPFNSLNVKFVTHSLERQETKPQQKTVVKYGVSQQLPQKKQLTLSEPNKKYCLAKPIKAKTKQMSSKLQQSSYLNFENSLQSIDQRQLVVSSQNGKNMAQNCQIKKQRPKSKINLTTTKIRLTKKQ